MSVKNGLRSRWSELWQPHPARSIDVRKSEHARWIGPKRSYLPLTIAVAVAALAALLFGTQIMPRAPDGKSSLGVFAFLLLPIVALPLFVSLFRTYHFDRRNGNFVWGRWCCRQRMPLGKIEAVESSFGGEFCYHDSDTGDHFYETWRIDLRTSQPGQERINISWHGDQAWSEETARDLAEFLRVPLNPPPAAQGT